MHHSFLSCTEVRCPLVPTYLIHNVTQPPPRSLHAKLELYRKLFFWGPTVTRHIKKNHSTLNISICCTSHCNESLDDNKFAFLPPEVISLTEYKAGVNTMGWLLELIKAATTWTLYPTARGVSIEGVHTLTRRPSKGPGLWKMVTSEQK